MSQQNKSVDTLLSALQERAKELNCLYRVEESLQHPDQELADVLRNVLYAIPPGWQYPEICHAQIQLNGIHLQTEDFSEMPSNLVARITSQDRSIGRISVCYTRSTPASDFGPFLKEEKKLLETVAERIGHFVSQRELKQRFDEWNQAKESLDHPAAGANWQLILNLLRNMDEKLFIRISRKMINHLCRCGFAEVTELLQQFAVTTDEDGILQSDDYNRPRQKKNLDTVIQLSEQAFRLATRYLQSEEIVSLVKKWIQEDKSLFLVKVLSEDQATITEVQDALTKYTLQSYDTEQLPAALLNGIKVNLVRRFLGDQLAYINVVKQFVEIEDFSEILARMIHTHDSHGKIGGKSAGIFLAWKILQRALPPDRKSPEIRIPNTWYISSDALVKFLHYNNLEDIVEQKYKSIEEIRREHPHIEQVIKNSLFPPEIVKGVGALLEEIGTRPIIVRSSSLLEDRMGAIFCGKYKSLFLANQGLFKERLDALLDAIAEVYASTFGPDPIEYRSERGLLDFYEEMGIIIQEVVGTEVGKYFFPAFAGVAFSTNEYRWSPRINREDGLVRLVPGLGTRAVDRLGDDYPVLVAPGQPGLRVNVVPEEVMRYSPRSLDVINLETNTFETVELEDITRQYSHLYPRLNQVVSIYKDGTLMRPIGVQFDPEQDQLVVTFDGLIANSSFIQRIRDILICLEEHMGTPVDIEFASDGTALYLLQCRPLSLSEASVRIPIPRDLEDKDIIFNANQHISNGFVPEIHYIVYVDPAGYAGLDSNSRLAEVGQVVGRLNKLLPKRKFILMGPGRWGSRGDIKLGVKVSYSDIKNTAMLIEIARKKGNYVPDLSFGTHFFQDLVEARILYLPLYPDNPNIIFNEIFLQKSSNKLALLVPEAEHLEETIRVIDIAENAPGRILRINLDAQDEIAVAYLCEPDQGGRAKSFGIPDSPVMAAQDHWRWRMHMAQEIAARLDARKYGVKNLYLFGSTTSGMAGPGSDIDLLVHVTGSQDEQDRLKIWLEGWSACLSEFNYLQTGVRTDGLLDIHFVSDEDVERRVNFADKIGGIADAALKLSIHNTEG